ncbi:MAG TPA: type II toxin-antitoxin system Phd/YefM family antitoxin [Burkholderiaceae bacterium]|jgi:hypothetical protein
METTKVGIREFRAGLAEYIAGEAPVAVTRHGQTVGYFIPTPNPSAADLEKLKKTSADLRRQLAEHSVDVEELVAEFEAARKAGRVAQRQPARRAKTP